MSGFAQTFVQIFERRVAESPARTALRYRDGAGEWTGLTWGQVGERVADVASGLVSLGLVPGDRVAIVSSTRWEWIVADFGVLLAGGVTVPIHPAETRERVRWQLEDSGSRFAFVADEEARQSLGPDGPERVFAFDAEDSGRGEPTTFRGLVERGAAGDVALELSERAQEVKAEDVATIVYTSGTTGVPKGVVLTQENLAWQCHATVAGLEFDAEDVQLLVLPLAHIFARILVAGFVRCGGVVALGTIPRLAEDLKTVRPTLFAGVPRTYERIQSAVTRAAQERGGLHARMFRWACDLGASVVDARNSDVALTTGQQLQHDAAMRLVGRRVADVFGGRARYLVCGQAPLPSAVWTFFAGFSVEILEGYGLTETTGATHVSRPGQVRAGSVGRPFEGVQTRLGEDAEILLRCPGVMRGYLGDEEATKRALDAQGWLHTGDIGRIDDDGVLWVTDRKKDVIVTAQGRHVAPLPIEGQLRSSPWIASAFVHGEGREFLCALVTLDEPSIRSWAEEQAIDFDDLAELSRHADVYGLVETEVKEVNARLPSYAQIRKFAVLSRDFSEGAGELTPTLKLKRRHIAEAHGDLIESFYREQY